MKIAYINPQGYYPRLRRTVWIGTFIVDALALLGMTYFFPVGVKPLGLGMLMGVFYLWSLFYNAEHPKKKIQFVFSLLRVAGLGYVIVQVSHGHVLELGLVIVGLLSYKLVLFLEMQGSLWKAFGSSPSLDNRSI